MNFDQILPLRDIHSSRWTRTGAALGVEPENCLPMWLADSDYPTAPCVLDAMRRAVDVGAFCYGYDGKGYLEAVRWWMATRHNWDIDPDWVVTAQGLGHAIATCIDVWSAPGEGVAYFTPVYHEFRLKTERAGRRPVELPMKLTDGRYELDLEAAEAAITPDTRVLLFCSPQNPSGRMWTPGEIRNVCAFCEKHDLILVSDEVHGDLTYDGNVHIPTDIAAPEFRHRTVTLVAASKTFNLAGLRVGQVIVPDAALRRRIGDRMFALNYDPSTIGIAAATAAFSPAGNDWVAAQMRHLTRNRDLFDEGINAIPGVRSMPLQATFLPWVDFSGTGMPVEEITRRILEDAGIGTAPGHWFGANGTMFHRFNLAMPRIRIEDAVARMQTAFADLQ